MKSQVHIKPKKSTFLRYLLPAIVWGIGIFIIISVPSGSIPKSKFLRIEHIDKIVHFGMFFGFSFLLCFGFFKQIQFLKLQKYYLRYAVFYSVLYGVLTEVFQAAWLSSRSGNIWDVLANTAGAIAGAFLFSGIIKPWFFKKPKLVD